MLSAGISRSNPPLRITVSGSDGRSVASLEGELDLATAPQLRENLGVLAEQNGADIVIDLTHLNFIDSTGFAVLVMALNRSRASGGSMVVRNPSASVMRIPEITGLASVLPVEGEDVVPTVGLSPEQAGESPIRLRDGTR
jgi:anti-sigma B factor antagonist